MSEGPDRALSVRRYVFYNEHRPSRAWMPTLELINDRFSQYLRTALLQHLRPRVDVTPPVAIQLIKYGELVGRLTAPSFLTLFNFKPLRGRMLAAMDAPLVSWIVESRFGGDGRFPLPIGNREFSPFEQKCTQRVVQTVIDQFVLAWQPIGGFEAEVARHEINPQFADVANSSDLMIVSTFDVCVGQGGGKLIVCIPYLMLEPLHDQLVTGIVKEAVDRDARWRDALTAGLARATMTLTVDLAKIDVTVRDLLGLQPGSVFEIDREDSVTVEANGSPLFRGRWGKYGQKIGVRVEERLQTSGDADLTGSQGRGTDGDDER
ncbi:MAG: flagellar motor switch protein FliM [Stellaceae bacterium]